MTTYLTRDEAAQAVRVARTRTGVTWGRLAEVIDRPVAWTTAALLGRHPLTDDQARAVGELLHLEDDIVEALRLQPTRPGLGEAAHDPTIYRFLEALAVYGPAIKELIHEEFGDGIMSAINFRVDVQRREDPDGDRVVVTFDGKFLDYRW